ncbi:hypothetical protein BDR26DRAFT_854268 [Obelidium mucronatum]|nr:hypothetical protein BDR26DRAFT_854268 [Obelidium mucronatum]
MQYAGSVAAVATRGGFSGVALCVCGSCSSLKHEYFFFLYTQPEMKLPPELTAEILSWVDPISVVFLRAVSRRFNECTASVSFATLNLSRTITSVSAMDTKETTIFHVDDALLFYGPPAYKIAAARWKAQLLESTNVSFYSMMAGSNHLIGTSIPTAIGELKILTLLDLGYCVTLLVHLHVLRLCGNKLTGNIPSCIGNCRDLRALNLASNQLSGTLPPSLGTLYSLKHLILSENNLSGEIPNEFMRLKELQDLFLGKNQLSGRLEERIFRDMNDNQFTGVIPDAFGNLENLQYLRVKGNRLHGPVSPLISEMIRSKRCDISTELLQ